MFGIYLFATVLGVGLLAFSFIGGDSDGGHDVSPDGGHHGPGDLLLGFFRPRNLVFFLAAFGLTGAALSLLNQASTLTLGLATGMGLGAMAINHALFSWLARTDAAIDTIADRDLEGVSGRVVLNVEPGRAGRIVCLAGGREQYLTARLASGIDGTLPTGREVVIVSVEGGVAHVAPLDLLNSSSSSLSLE